MPRNSMTYGTLPNRNEFIAAFDEVCADTGRFEVRRDPFHGDHDFTSEGLWAALKLAVSDFENGRDAAGEWASAVLSVLGFEWV